MKNVQNVVLKHFLFIALGYRAFVCSFVSERSELCKRFLGALVHDGPIRWRSIAIIVDDAIDLSLDNWVFEVNIPKIIYSLSSEEFSPDSNHVDAYILPLFDSNKNVLLNLVKTLKSKADNLKKPIFAFVESDELDFELRQLNDVTLIREIRIWNQEKKSFLLESLKFRRIRSHSKLESKDMIGLYFGTKYLDENARKILYDNSFSYHGNEVKVSAFKFPPTTVVCTHDRSKLCGRDVNLIETLGHMLNFKPKFVEQNAKWGDILDNGTWTGLIGDVSRGITPLGVANIFMSQHYMEQVDVSYPYDLSCFTFLTPPRQPLPQWFTLIKPFSPSLWLATIFSLFFGGVLIQLSAMFYHWLFNSTLRDRLLYFGEAMMYNAQCITGVRSGSDEFPAWPNRLYNTNWWLFCFLIGTVYRTGLISWVASSPILMAPVDSLTLLVKSGLIPYGYNAFIRDIAQYSTDPTTIELGRRQKLIPDNMTIQALMSEDDSKAIYENKDYLKYIAATVIPPSLIQTNNSTRALIDPKQRFHVMKECLRTYPVVIALTPGSILKEILTKKLHRLSEAGLLEYWLNSVIHREIPSSKGLSLADDHEYVPFSVYHLEGFFYLLLVCYSIVVVAFICELVIYYFKVYYLHFTQNLALKTHNY